MCTTGGGFRIRSHELIAETDFFLNNYRTYGVVKHYRRSLSQIRNLQFRYQDKPLLLQFVVKMWTYNLLMEEALIVHLQFLFRI